MLLLNLSVFPYLKNYLKAEIGRSREKEKSLVNGFIPQISTVVVGGHQAARNFIQLKSLSVRSQLIHLYPSKHISGEMALKSIAKTAI